MHRRHPSPRPRLWLMTDERMGDGLLRTIAALPKGSGVIFRHYSLPQKARAAMFHQIRAIAKRRRLVLIRGGRRGQHGRERGCITAPVHSIPERIAAERAGAKLLFVSPVFETRTHPGARALGRVRFGLLIKGAKRPVIALGGMTHKRARSLNTFAIHGWAGIDAFGV